jgi:Tn3 transposase DDE domain
VDLMRQAYALLPRVKITDPLIEVDSWCDFTGHFLHLKNEEPPKNKVLVLTAVLADAINLGVTRMADACPGISANKLARINTLYIRDETYTKARAHIITNWRSRRTSAKERPVPPTLSVFARAAEAKRRGGSILAMATNPEHFLG